MQVQKLLQESLVSSQLVLLNIRGNDLEVDYILVHIQGSNIQSKFIDRCPSLNFWRRMV